MTSEEFQLAARAKYDSLGGVAGEDADAPTGSIEASTKVTTTVTTKIKELTGNEFIDTIGGTAVSAVGIKSSKDWNAWAASIASRPAFLGFEEDGLMPVWELASDQARRTAIYQAYRRKAAKEFAPEILSVTSDVRAHPEARVVVPEGYKLLCGGALDNWQGEGNLLTASFPESDNTWLARGKDHTKADWTSISVFALAVYDPDDIWEVRIFQSRPSASGGWPEQEVTVESGYVMVGGGAKTDFTGAGNMLIASHPVDESKTTWHVQAKDHVQADAGKITAYAVGLKCKAEGVKLQSAITTAKSGKSGRPQAAAAAPSGYKMVGGGAAITFDGPGILLTGSYPIEDNQWKGLGKDHLAADNGTITVYCIGLKVEASST